MADTDLRGLKRILELEKQAQNLRLRMDAVELEWNERMSNLRARFPAEWAEYCEKEGLYPRYNFGDVQA